MGKNLVIVESPAKAKTINKILGADFIVKASMGHVRDLPQKELGIDIENGFKPKYVTIKGREKIITELRKEAKTADQIFLAPDPDREGEAIAWHLMAELKRGIPEERFCRVSYNEITAPAIRKAFAEPGPINQHKVDSQQARRVLDRIVGYKVSPLLWRRVRGAVSAGRVQSVALRLVCEREKDITDFKPQEYWLLGAKVRKQVDPRDPFEIRLARVDGEKAEIKTRERADGIRQDLEGRALRVSAIIPRELTRKAFPPYITSSLQQAGSSALGYAPAYTMKLAQRLYEGEDFGEGPVGLITYMRTDSFSVSREAQEACRAFVANTYGKEYLPDQPNFYRSKASAQEAHEAIRPTDVNRTPDQLTQVLEADELKLYRLIWQRFVASQMAPARIAQRTVEVEAPPPANKTSTYLFRATASEVVFPGYMKVTGVEEKKKDENGEEVDRLPPVEVGEGLDLIEWLEQQKFTQPPPRYTEASLVKALEENGVGRPSTYAQILATLLGRKYVIKEKRALQPTSLGMQTNDFLVSQLGELFDVGFTATMEAKLDEIESGSVGWQGMMDQFYQQFVVWLEKAKGPKADPKVVLGLVALLEGVKNWSPAVKRGKRTYSDEKFVPSVKQQLEKGKPISERQVTAMVNMACRYKDQLPDIEKVMHELGLAKDMEEACKPPEPPDAATLQKLDLLKSVNFKEARTVGKKVFDDRVFFDSLNSQVIGGRGLSEAQIRYLDRLFLKYAEQIPGFDGLVESLGLKDIHDTESGPLLESLRPVKTWKPPVKRGRREWDDQKFYESLSRQFRERRNLSPKQSSSLRKMIKRYAEQIPNYQELSARFNLGATTKRRPDEPAEPIVAKNDHPSE